MKQLIQHLDTGLIEHLEVPDPQTPPHHIKVALEHSAISPGTERMLLAFGRGNLVQKVMQQPERVVEVIQKAKTDGIMATAQAIESKLQQPIPVGYASAGIVVEVGEGVRHFSPGDRVACNGPHAQTVVVSKHLSAKIPTDVPSHHACMATLGAIALQGIRLANPTYGEQFAVIGLGTLGLWTACLLQDHGCEVVGLDIADEPIDKARALGIERAYPPNKLPQTHDMDGVIICASSKDSGLFRQAAQICRHGGRIILVGVAPIELDRRLFYDKGLSFEVSCAYGPGRYESAYEQQGVDYPKQHVRWTAQRNLQAILNYMRKHPQHMDTLLAKSMLFEDAATAYEAILRQNSGPIVLRYPKIRIDDNPPTLIINRKIDPGTGSIGVIGAGNYAQRVFLPRLLKSASNQTVKTIVSTSGLSASIAAKQHNIAQTSTNPEDIFNDPGIDAVCILTRHDTHAELVRRALEANKHVFVEKPLAIDQRGLEGLAAARQALPGPILMVGYNRRFAPLSVALKSALHHDSPKQFHMTFNAGALPHDHWTRQPEQGGRLIGEASHGVDLMRYLAGVPLCEIQVMSDSLWDRGTITMCFADGSTGSILYTDLGHNSYPKERLEVFCDGSTWVLDNFKSLTKWPHPTFDPKRWRPALAQDKGHSAMIEAWLEAIYKTGQQPIPDEEIFDVARGVLALKEV